MLLETNIVEGPYLQDILDQPAALRRTLDGLGPDPTLARFAAELARGDYNRIVLTGMGSSLFSLYPLHLTLTNLGLPSLLVETAELIHYFGAIFGPRTLVLAVSQSGQSAEIVRLLDSTHGKSPVIGVTNDPCSELARRADVAVLIRAGVESAVSCKTYVCSLAALHWLSAVLSSMDACAAADDLELAVPLINDYVEGWRSHVASFGTLIAGVRHIFVVGRGPSIASAQTGGLILKESTRFAAEGMSSAAFRHGPFEALAPHVLVVILQGDAHGAILNQRLADDVRIAGGRPALLGPKAGISALAIPATADAIRPILEILPVQMLTLALAAASGREAGRFELATKITAVE